MATYTSDFQASMNETSTSFQNDSFRTNTELKELNDNMRGFSSRYEDWAVPRQNDGATSSFTGGQNTSFGVSQIVGPPSSNSQAVLSALKALQTKINSLKDENKRLEAALRTNEDKFSTSMRGEQERIKHNYQQLLMKAEDDNRALQARHEDEVRKLRVAESDQRAQLIASRAEVEHLKSQNETLVSQKNDLTSDLEHVRSLLHKAESEKGLLEQRFSELHHTISSEMSHSSTRVSEVEAKYAHLKNYSESTIQELEVSFVDFVFVSDSFGFYVSILIASSDCPSEIKFFFCFSTLLFQTAMRQQNEKIASIEADKEQLEDYLRHIIESNSQLRDEMIDVLKRKVNTNSKLELETKSRSSSVGKKKKTKKRSTSRSSFKAPTKSSLMKSSRNKSSKSSKSIHEKFGFDLPFTVGTNTGQSHSLPVNVQEILGKKPIYLSERKESKIKTVVAPDHRHAEIDFEIPVQPQRSSRDALRTPRSSQQPSHSDLDLKDVITDIEDEVFSLNQ